MCMMASTVVAGLGSPVARLACSAVEAHPSSLGMESEFLTACVLRSPRRLASSAAGFPGARRICVESPRVVSPGRDEGVSCRAYAHTATYDQTEEREKVGNPTTRNSRNGGEPTLYDILGLTEDAGVMEIKSAFRQLARRFHPDVNAEEQRGECTRDFMRIHAAYTSLSDPESKAAYDLQLSMQRFQRNGYSCSRVTPLTQNWDYSAPTGLSSPAGYSSPSSFNTEWKGRKWETDQCW